MIFITVSREEDGILLDIPWLDINKVVHSLD